MSRIPKWKVEMTKVKVVFRLQFHLTHIPQPGWDKLYLSFIPCDTGKATAKTTKANVRNGNCKWSDPIYETTRLIQDTRSKKYEEKLYKLVVAMGTSRSVLGEVNFNLADFADASKPSSIALPLHGCEFGTILHVTVQLLTSKTGFREFEKQRELTVKGFQMISEQRNQGPAESITASSDTTSEQTDMVDARVKLKANSTDFHSREGVEELNEDYEDSAAGVDGSSCTSESLNTEKNDMSNMHEVDSLKSTASGDLGRYLHGQTPKPGTENQCVKRLLAQGSNDWSHGWSTDYSVNNVLVSSYDENNLRVRLEATQAAFIQLKLEAKSLKSITDDLGAETQILTQQLAAELASGQKLTREVTILKSECSKLKDDLEDLKSEKSQFQITMIHDLGDASVNSNHGDKDLASGQNYYLQGLYLIESKLREIQNKTFLEYHGSDFDLHTDFEALGSVLQSLKQGITQKTLAFVDETPVKDFRTTGTLQSEQHILGYIDHHRPQLMPHFLGIPHQIFHEEEPVKHSFDAASIKEEMYELLQKLEESKIEKESLAKKIDQMECYYEALIQGLEESQKQTLNELQNSRSEHVSCLHTISTLQSQLEKMHQDMNEQLTRFSEDRHCLDSLNKELELRAISSETALKRVRMNYSVAVDRLQKDLELLSFQVLSMYESNGSIAKQTFTDALQVEARSCSPKDDALIPLKKEQHRPLVATVLPEIGSNINNVSSAALYHSPETAVPVNVKVQMIDESNGHINGLKLEDAVSSETHRRIKLPENLILKLSRDSEGIDNNDTLPSQNQCPEPDNKSVVGSSGLEELKMTFNMQTELQSNNEDQLSEILVLNIHLEVFSDILLETLRDADAGIGHMKDHMDRLTRQLAHTTGIKESLMLSLHNALDELKILKEHEARSMSKCDDLTFKNHVLEAKLLDVLEENTCSIQKVFELERLLMESKVFENKYAACNEEKIECENLLRQESLKRSGLQSEISCMNGEFKALKQNLNKQSSMNDDLQKTLSLLQEKLGDLYSNMISCCKQLDDFTVDGLNLSQEIECKNYMGMLMHLGWFQKEAYETLVQLRQEKADIERKKDCMKNLLGESESQALCMKQKFESELVVLAKDLDFSNAVSEKVQQELQDVSEKLKISSVAEEKQATTNRELSSKLTVMENELQHATEENRNLVQKLLLLDSVNEDFEKVKLRYTNCLQENKNLMMSIQTANQASIQIENEFNSLKETLRYAHDELECERRFSQELEGAITDLTSQLNEKGQELLSFNEQKAELAHLRKRISDLDAENSRLGHILLQSEEFQRGLEGESFSLRLQIVEMENHMTAIFECSLTTEIELTFMRSQFHCRVQEFTGQCKALEGDLEKLHSTHVEAAAALKLCMFKEEQLVNENYRLSEALHSLKSEHEKVASEKNGLVDYINKNNETQTEVEDMKIRFATVEAEYGQEKEKYVDEICQLKNMLVSFEKEIDNLRLLRDELEITDTILRSKLDEPQAQILVSEAYGHELRKLREQNNDLSYKLSEQIFKTEEFKNLSLHLRELKDKADAECCQARDRRESEGPSLAVQDSLRIAFIKEQYETKLQDLRNQHQVSKKYAEEMLIKLQNALGEVEIGRKNEISLAKRIEELSIKISDLENELQTITTDRRELVKAYDRMKAELECTILSLDCCKEEKSKLEASLQECHEERAKLRVELDLVKRVLENMASITDIEAQKNLESDFANTSIGQLLEKANSELSLVSEQTPRTGDSCCKKDSIIYSNIYPANTVFNDNLPEVCCTMTSSVEEDSNLISANKISNTSLQTDLPALQDDLVPISAVERDTLLEDYTKQFPDIKEHFKDQQRLKASMDLLYDELEMLKNENLSSLIPLEGNHFDPAVQVLERELTQLDMANDRLESIYPSYRDFPGTANALERVLALELEFAEALQAKKKSDLHFRSSFLRQHDDDAAVYQSFRDINDLMKDMLELKKRNVAVEAELKEMQGRYSQLSLQFAEVEGERQKLVMTLKNRTPRKS